MTKLEDLDLILRERRLHWFGHVEHSSSAVRTACDNQIDGRRGGGGGGGGKIAVSGSSRKEHLDMRCEICYVCS